MPRLRRRGRRARHDAVRQAEQKQILNTLMASDEISRVPIKVTAEDRELERVVLELTGRPMHEARTLARDWGQR